MVAQSLDQLENHQQQSQHLLLKIKSVKAAVKKLSKMNTYRIKLEVDAEIQAFNEDDAVDYVSDIFGVDDEVKNVKVVSVKEK